VHFLEWQGSLQDEASLVEALKQVDVVICAVSSNQVLDQKLLIPAIKQAGCIKVFISSFLLGFFFFQVTQMALFASPIFEFGSWL